MGVSFQTEQIAMPFKCSPQTSIFLLSAKLRSWVSLFRLSRISRQLCHANVHHRHLVFLLASKLRSWVSLFRLSRQLCHANVHHRHLIFTCQQIYSMGVSFQTEQIARPCKCSQQTSNFYLLAMGISFQTEQIAMPCKCSPQTSIF